MTAGVRGARCGFAWCRAKMGLMGCGGLKQGALKGNREVRMLYMILSAVMIVAGIAALVLLMSRRSVRDGERIAKEMVEDDVDVTREEEEETRERKREWEG